VAGGIARRGWSKGRGRVAGGKGPDLAVEPHLQVVLGLGQDIGIEAVRRALESGWHGHAIDGLRARGELEPAGPVALSHIPPWCLIRRALDAGVEVGADPSSKRPSDSCQEQEDIPFSYRNRKSRPGMHLCLSGLRRPVGPATAIVTFGRRLTCPRSARAGRRRAGRRQRPAMFAWTMAR
jgi:hypothetical protein